MLCGHGFDRTPDNILGIVDRALLGESHMCNDMGIDPEGILSTIPSIAHTMLGFWMAAMCLPRQDNKASLSPLLSGGAGGRLFFYGSLLLLSGFLLSGVCPISKKIWSPTFVMVTCGAACLLLGVLIEILDIRHRGLRVGKFFSVFGVNPLFLYLLSEGILWPLMLIQVSPQSSLWDTLFHGYFEPLFGEQGGDLAFALVNVLFCWLVGYILYCRKIFIRL